MPRKGNGRREARVGAVIPVLKLRVDKDDDDDDDSESKGEYVRIEGYDDDGRHLQSPSSIAMGCSRWWYLWWWAKLVLLLSFFAVLAVVFLKWIGPFFLDKGIIPIINWETTTFSTPILAVIVFASVSLFPTLLLPSTPAMWLAGMTFGYGYGFLLIIAAVAVGVSIPYFLGSLFHYKIQGWLEKYPKKAAIIRLAGEGDWFNQFRAVTLIRISPFPYILYNYCARATNVKYCPYLLGSLVGVVPEIFVTIYIGILIQTLANASQDQHSLSAPQIIINVIGFCATLFSTVIATVYAKRRLKQLQDEEEIYLQ